MSAQYVVAIGLECHAQLRTRSKLFCSCSTRFGDEPNANTCPVCLGLPGALPVLNGEAVRLAVLAGLALGCEIRERSVFERKNYFYPDLPKGYQISQYLYPLAVNGKMVIGAAGGTHKEIGIIRAHMEEDAGKLLHPEGDGRYSQVDLNRCGTPLLEIVSAPDLSSPQEAKTYLQSLREILVHVGVCDGVMEEGSLRCDANVSLGTPRDRLCGTRTEIKNLNSFRFLEQALEYEIERQRGVLDRGERVIQETRGYDAERRVTYSQRSKEDAHDYRYFPEPDLRPLLVPPALVARVASALTELPAARRARFVAAFGVSEADAELLTSQRELADYFEEVVRATGDGKQAANWVQSELLRELNNRGLTAGQAPVRAAQTAELLQRISSGAITGPQGREVYAAMWAEGKDAGAVIRARGIERIGDVSTLAGMIAGVIAANPGPVADFRAGKERAFGFLMGQVMQRSKGQADPKVAQQLLRSALGG
ncbi:MAG: Asp-tRNA(Asn)/Glu-tRNA(Gln) amidotransferase subunit GatB [Candidatus Schekmanbacteria bacterium]|nr:Asp-tRNA(Asn)/Glu-tRNA(Gln) amidotransferase subunit GatB [Candidatus Schekmanbacteria bacterium]